MKHFSSKFKGGDIFAVGIVSRETFYKEIGAMRYLVDMAPCLFCCPNPDVNEILLRLFFRSAAEAVSAGPRPEGAVICSLTDKERTAI